MTNPLPFFVVLFSALVFAVAGSQGSQKVAAPLWGCLPSAGWQHVMRQVQAASSEPSHVDAASHSDYLGYMLANFSTAAASGTAKLDSDFLAGSTHYRLVPGIFMDGIDYHFDGLATVFKFSFNSTHVSWMSRPYDSSAILGQLSTMFQTHSFTWRHSDAPSIPLALFSRSKHAISQQPCNDFTACDCGMAAHFPSAAGC